MNLMNLLKFFIIWLNNQKKIKNIVKVFSYIYRFSLKANYKAKEVNGFLEHLF